MNTAAAIDFKISAPVRWRSGIYFWLSRQPVCLPAVSADSVGVFKLIWSQWWSPFNCVSCRAIGKWGRFGGSLAWTGVTSCPREMTCKPSSQSRYTWHLRPRTHTPSRVDSVSKLFQKPREYSNSGPCASSSCKVPWWCFTHYRKDVKGTLCKW